MRNYIVVDKRGWFLQKNDGGFWPYVSTAKRWKTKAGAGRVIQKMEGEGVRCPNTTFVKEVEG
jgi:hypothetical protein